jgi:hypothetical protein
MPVIKYNTLMLGVGMYLKINKSNWDLYKENTSDSDTDYTLFKNPKVKKADYGIIVLIGSFSKINDGLLGISLELKFSINKPILYYDYYNTGSFPYTARGFLLGEGNYFTIMIVFHLGVGW